MIDKVLCKWCNVYPAKKTFCSHPCRNAWTSWNNKNNNPVWDPTTRDKMANALKGKKQNPETVKKRVSAIQKRREVDPTLTERQTKAVIALAKSKPKSWWKIRNEVIARDRNTCQLCDKVGVKLVVHHKDHKGRNLSSHKLMNNDRSNLITLCYSCHLKIHTWTVRKNLPPVLAP